MKASLMFVFLLINGTHSIDLYSMLQTGFEKVKDSFGLFGWSTQDPSLNKDTHSMQIMESNDKKMYYQGVPRNLSDLNSIIEKPPVDFKIYQDRNVRNRTLNTSVKLRKPNYHQSINNGPSSHGPDHIHKPIPRPAAPQEPIKINIMNRGNLNSNEDPNKRRPSHPRLSPRFRMVNPNKYHRTENENSMQNNGKAAELLASLPEQRNVTKRKYYIVTRYNKNTPWKKDRFLGIKEMIHNKVINYQLWRQKKENNKSLELLSPNEAQEIWQQQSGEYKENDNSTIKNIPEKINKLWNQKSDDNLLNIPAIMDTNPKLGINKRPIRPERPEKPTRPPGRPERPPRPTKTDQRLNETTGSRMNSRRPFSKYHPLANPKRKIIRRPKIHPEHRRKPEFNQITREPNRLEKAKGTDNQNIANFKPETGSKLLGQGSAPHPPDNPIRLSQPNNKIVDNNYIAPVTDDFENEKDFEAYMLPTDVIK